MEGTRNRDCHSFPARHARYRHFCGEPGRGGAADRRNHDAGRPVPRVLWIGCLYRRGARRAGVVVGVHFLRPAVLAVPGPGHLGTFIELRAGGRAAVSADGRDPVAVGPVRATLSRAQCLDAPLAGRPVAYEYRGLRGILRDLGIECGNRGHHGLGRIALLREESLRSAHGVGLAGRRRRPRQLDTTRHHLHRLRADDRDIGRQDVYCRYRSERARAACCFSPSSSSMACACRTRKSLHRPPRRKDGEASSTLCRRRF